MPIVTVPAIGAYTVGHDEKLFVPKPVGLGRVHVCIGFNRACPGYDNKLVSNMGRFLLGIDVVAGPANAAGMHRWHGHTDCVEVFCRVGIFKVGTGYFS